MDPEIAELVASLPDEQAAPSIEEELQALFRTIGSKPVPTNRVFRALTMGMAPIKLAAAYAAMHLQGVFADEERKRLLRNKAHLQAAARLLGSMGYLRGAVVKMGQTLAAYPNLVPEQYADLLGALHFQAPPMHYALLREHIHNELGGDPEELFAEFETEAFAAASLGQVHRARLKSGEHVAVKIQYPNIARTIRSDFANLRILFQPLRILNDWDNMMEQGRDVEETLLIEADYENEARNLGRIRTILADLEGVVLPRHFPELSTKRVLTMEYLPGVHLRDYLAGNPSREERNLQAERIFRATYRPWCTERLIHSDVNPGNFVFMKDGRLGLIDFGCIRSIDDEAWDVMMTAFDGLQGDRAALLRSIQHGALLSDEEMRDAKRVELIEASMWWIWKPLFEEEFDFRDGEYLARGFEIYADLVKHRITRQMPIFTWMNRLLFGVRALFYRLGATLPYQRLDREERALAGF